MKQWNIKVVYYFHHAEMTKYYTAIIAESMHVTDIWLVLLTAWFVYMHMLPKDTSCMLQYDL